MHKITISFVLIIGLYACLDQPPGLNSKSQNLLKAKQIYTEKRDLSLRDTVYVPIYSDIYSKTKDVRFNLTATLSIRNTSLSDSIYIEDIDYYDSNGRLVRNYLEKVLLLPPMHSIEYVIEEDDTEGGTGANFIINWGATVMDVKPVFQGVMISTHGQQGISFLTEGIPISRKK